MLAATLALATGFAAQPAVNILVFSKTAGFRHDSIATGIETIKSLGEKEGYTVAATEDAAIFSDASLRNYQVVVFLNTTGDILNDVQQAAFERFIRSKRGFVGIHAAADTEYDWPWYGQLVGAYFLSHPAIQKADVLVKDRKHPATSHLPEVWARTDEWYDYKAAPVPSVRILALLDTTTYQGHKMGENHPISWCHEFQGGRAFYTGGGHTKESFAEPAFRQHLLGAIQWAARIKD